MIEERDSNNVHQLEVDTVKLSISKSPSSTVRSLTYNKKLSYCLKTARCESVPEIAEIQCNISHTWVPCKFLSLSLTTFVATSNILMGFCSDRACECATPESACWHKSVMRRDVLTAQSTRNKQIFIDNY